MAKTIAELKLASNTIKNEVNEGANTATRLGTHFKDIVDFIEVLDEWKSNVFVLFGSDKVEASDVTKLDNANKCIKVLYLKNRPTSGHRYVLTYLYHWGTDSFQISIADYNESTGASSAVLSSYNFTGDSLQSIKDASGNEIGKVYASTTDYTSLIADQGEGNKRLPYLNEVCFTQSQNMLISYYLDNAEKKTDELSEDVEAIKEQISPELMLSKGIEASDITKMENANKEVKALYMYNKPASGHRYVLTYLYYQNDGNWFVSISDYNESAGTSTTIVNQYKATDKVLSPICNASGTEVGLVLFDSTNYHLIADQGEGTNRLPYLSDVCFNRYSQQEILRSDVSTIKSEADENSKNIESLKVSLFPILFGSKQLEASDITKQGYANECIKAIYLKNKPASGHRYVLNQLYLQTSDQSVYITITDYNESTGASSAVVSNVNVIPNQLSDIKDSSGNVIGCIFADSSKYHLIADQGEGLNRLPYLNDVCFDDSSQYIVSSNQSKNRLDTLESSLAKKQITMWGDSITWGSASTTNEKCYPMIVQSMLVNDGYPHKVVNCGVGGDNMQSILAREGGTALYLTKDITINKTAGQITEIDRVSNYVRVGKYIKTSCDPDNDAVNIMLQGDLGRGTTESEYKTVNPIMINGIPCIWNWVSTDGFKEGYFTITSEKTLSGNVLVKAGTPFVTHGSKIKSDIVVLSMGTNGGFQESSVDASIEKYIRLVDLAIEASNTKKYIVCTPYGGIAMNDMGASGLSSLEDACAKRYGARFFNWRKFMMNEALSMEGLTATSADTAAINSGKCPPSLLSDEVHPNDYGHHALGKRLYQMMNDLGYFD